MTIDITKKIGNDWKNHFYYERSESVERLAQFWGPDTIFIKRFAALDKTNLCELACGHGRHVPQYVDKCENVCLIDINCENIEFCKKKFENIEKIKFYVNNGNQFNEIPDNSQTAIFSYDAMVHFDILDIGEYIRDSWRILKPGGRILYHHSNYYYSPGRYYNHNPHSRNFMSDKIFAHMAITSGFEILSQDIINWGHSSALDCLSLCEKLI